MYPRNSVFSRPSRGHNSQEWSQTQDSQEWIDSQDMRVPAAPQIRQIVRNNNQVVPTSQHVSHAQNVGSSTPVDVNTTEDAREIVARDLRFGLHMMLNLIKELPEQMKQDVSEVVQSQSSQEELKTHLMVIKEHLETLINNIEEKLNKLLDNSDNSQTLQTSLSQKEEMILSLQVKIDQLEARNNQEQQEWFVEQLQEIRKELKKQLKRCHQEITNIPKESGLQNFTEVIAAELHRLQDTLQEKFMDLSKDNKVQMEIVESSMEDNLNDLKSFLSTKMDEHYENIKEMLPEVVAKQVKSLDRCYSRPSPLSDISNRFISPAVLNSSQGHTKDHFIRSSPVAAIKPLVKNEPETPRNVRSTDKNNMIPSSCEYQRSSVAKNVRKPIRALPTNVIPYKRVAVPEDNLPKATTNHNIIESRCKKSRFDTKKEEPQRLLIQDTSQFDFQVSSEISLAKDKRRVSELENNLQKSSTPQHNIESRCKKSRFDTEKVKLQRLMQDTQQFDFQMSSEINQVKDKKLTISAYSSDSEEDSVLSIYILSADEDNTDLLDISTPPSKISDKNLPALKIVSHSNSISNINPVQPVLRTRIYDQIENNCDSNKNLLKKSNKEKLELVENIQSVSTKSDMVRKVKRESFRFFTLKNRRNSFS